MNDTLMRHPQHTTPLPAPLPTAAWELPPGQALRLTVGPGPRKLHVLQGRVWLTRQGQADDIWLQPGDEMALESGSEWVAEGWPHARFQLLVPPCATHRRRAAPVNAPLAWRRAWLARA